MYAIIETGGKQYRVSPGESVEVESLSGEIGDSLEIESVLLLANDGDVLVGKPTVAGAAVRATVVEQGRGGKVTVFKFRGGNRYQRKQGHRQYQPEMGTTVRAFMLAGHVYHRSIGS